MMDVNKPYGVTYGTGFNHVYTQDGKLFNAAFQEVDDDGNVIEDKQTKRGRPSKTTLSD